MATSQWTTEADAKLREYLYREGYVIPKGLGTEEEACSVAAINLALTGKLTDTIPECMSEVVGNWIIGVQDYMPDEMRNSPEWKDLLPLAAGTGREHETERLAIILDWMWGTVLPSIQDIADKYGYGDEWRTMCAERTHTAATAAANASDAADAAVAASRAARAADAAAEAGAAATAVAASRAARAADAAVDANSAVDAAVAAANWQKFDPVGLLRRLVEVVEV